MSTLVNGVSWLPWVLDLVTWFSLVKWTSIIMKESGVKVRTIKTSDYLTSELPQNRDPHDDVIK